MQQSSALHVYRSPQAEIHFEENAEKGLSISIDTQHLHIRSFEREDFPSLVRLYTNEAAMALFCSGLTWTEEKSRAVFERIMNDRRTHNPYSQFAVCSKEGEFLGVVSLSNFEREPVPGEVELGGIGFPSYWRQGFGIEAAGVMVREFSRATRQEGYLIGGKPLQSIFATAHPNNTGSWKILERLGMSYKGDGEKFGRARRFYSLDIPPS